MIKLPETLNLIITYKLKQPYNLINISLVTNINYYIKNKIINVNHYRINKNNIAIIIRRFQKNKYIKWIHKCYKLNNNFYIRPNKISYKTLKFLYQEQIYYNHKDHILRLNPKSNLRNTYLLVKIVLKLYDYEKFDDNLDLFRESCEYGHLKLLKWLHLKYKFTLENVRIWNNYALRYACENGHLNICKWLKKKFDLTVNDIICQQNFCLLGSSKNNKEQIVLWILKNYNFKLSRDLVVNIIKNFCLYENVRMIKYMSDTYL